MDCKIVITCEKCKCKAELDPHTWAGSSVYACPNCGKRMPVNYWVALEEAISSLAMVPEECDGFSISFSNHAINPTGDSQPGKN